MFSPQQLQQLLQLIPATSIGHESAEDAMDSPFSSMIMCDNVQVTLNDWIVDTGATNHMTSNLNLLVNIKSAVPNLTVNLPTGSKAIVTHTGDLQLHNGLKLLNVLYVPFFTHNLLSIHKLSEDNDCYAVFSPKFCTIVDTKTHTVKAKGMVSNGLYHMSNTHESTPLDLQCLTVTTPSLSDQYSVWHNRLGHAPVSKLKYIDCVKHCVHASSKVCLTCLMNLVHLRPLNSFTLIFGDLTRSVLDKSSGISSQLWMTSQG